MEEQVKAKLQFGTISAIAGQTPKWAQWVFRIVFLLTTIAVFIITGDNHIALETKVRVCVYLKGLDMLIYGLSKMFGIPVTEADGGEAVMEKTQGT